MNKLLAVSVAGNTCGLSLNATGTCPGTSTITVDGATPGSSVQIFASAHAGSNTITSGGCAGTVLSLAKARLLATATADANGHATAQIRLNAKRRGQLLQAIDLNNCATTNVVTGP